MRKVFILVSAFLTVFFYFPNALASGEVTALNKFHADLFGVLSKYITIKGKELNSFSLLIKKYIETGKTDFGEPASLFSANIAIVNGSLVVGYARAKAEKMISMSSINFIKNQYETLYFHLYAHALPFRMLGENPQFVLMNNIIPTYNALVSFDEIRDNYFDLMALSDIHKPAQLFVLQAVTGIASGFALGKERKSLTKDDIEIAKAESCKYWPDCGEMIRMELSKLYPNYQGMIRQVFFAK